MEKQKDEWVDPSQLPMMKLLEKLQEYSEVSKLMHEKIREKLQEKEKNAS